MDITFPKKRGRGGSSQESRKSYIDSLKKFADDMIRIQEGIDFQMGARGWCYALEPHGLEKSDFDWMQSQIQECRLLGYLKPGFILEEDGHAVTQFQDDEIDIENYFDSRYSEWRGAEQTFRDSWKRFCDVSFWDYQDYYIQLLVEKSDLKSLFMKICSRFGISIANMRGWGSLEQKATMAANFQRAEEKGLTPVLLACGDFDPPGISISESLEKQFQEYSVFTGWNPENLIIERIGLSYDLIVENGLSWVDNLMTGSGRDLGDPNHSCYRKNTYGIREYIQKYGERKCEANSIVVVPELGRKMLQDAIDRYLGPEAYNGHLERIQDARGRLKEMIDATL